MGSRDVWPSDAVERTLTTLSAVCAVFTTAPERESHDVVILKTRLEDAVLRLNPQLPPEAKADAIRKLTQSELPNLLEENRRIHKLLTEGVDVEYYADNGVLTAGKVLLLDFERPESNDWLAVQQFVVISGQYKRRPDVVLFVNDKFKVIAHELLVSLKGNISVDGGAPRFGTGANACAGQAHPA